MELLQTKLAIIQKGGDQSPLVQTLRRQLAVPPIQSPDPGTGAVLPPPHLDGHHDLHSGPPGGMLSGSRDGAEIPSHEIPGSDQGHPLETSGEPQSGSHLGSPPQALPQLCLDTGGNQHEGPFSDHQPPCTTAPGNAGQTPQGEGKGTQGQESPDHPLNLDLTDQTQRWELAHLLSTLPLTNADSDCFRNAAFQAWIWATLCDDNATNGHWGPQHHLLHRSLCASGSQMTLTEMPWMQPFLAQWGDTERQGDVTEFTQLLISAMLVTGPHHAWQRRSLTAAGETKIEDSSPGGAPLALYFPEAVTPTDHVLLMELFATWCREQDMFTALTSVPQLLCVHIGRFRQTNSFIIKQFAEVRFWQGTSVPVFSSDAGLEVQWVRTQALAAIAHLGGPRSGHYRAAVRLVQPDTMNQWMIFDDLGSSLVCWKPPRWFCDNVVLVWLGNLEGTQAPVLQCPGQTPARDDLDAAHRMLQMIPQIR